MNIIKIFLINILLVLPVFSQLQVKEPIKFRNQVEKSRIIASEIKTHPVWGLKIGDEIFPVTLIRVDSMYVAYIESDSGMVTVGYLNADSVYATTVRTPRIEQYQRTTKNISNKSSFDEFEILNSYWIKPNLMWDSTKTWFMDSLSHLKLYPNNGFPFVDSTLTFTPRHHSPYHLDGWKYSYGYNKKGGVTIRIDEGAGEGTAEMVLALFEKYGARAFYVASGYSTREIATSFHREILLRGHEVHYHSFNYSLSAYDLDTLGSGEYRIKVRTDEGDTLMFTTDTTGTDSVAWYQIHYFNKAGLNQPAYSDWSHGGDLFYTYQKGVGKVARDWAYEATKRGDGIAGSGGDLAYGNPINTRYGLQTSWDGQLRGLDGQTGSGETIDEMLFNVSDAVAKHYVTGDHLHAGNTANSKTMMSKLDSLLRFCFENKILVTGIIDWVHITLDMPHNPYVNIAPRFDIDLNADGLSDGWDLFGGLTTGDRYTNDGYDADYAWELDKSTSDELHCGVTESNPNRKPLYGWEEGVNTVGLAIKGISGYDSVYVVIAGTNKDGAFTETIAFPVTASWAWNETTFENTFQSKTSATGRSRSVRIYPKNGVVRVSAPLIKKKY